jgi:hypothetical protein
VISRERGGRLALAVDHGPRVHEVEESESGEHADPQHGSGDEHLDEDETSLVDVATTTGHAGLNHGRERFCIRSGPHLATASHFRHPPDAVPAERKPPSTPDEEDQDGNDTR